MATHRALAETVNAFQLTEAEGTDPQQTNWPQWLIDARAATGTGSMRPDPSDPNGEKFIIQTAEGIVSVIWDDWICLHADGRLHRMTPAEFTAAWEVIPP